MNIFSGLAGNAINPGSAEFITRMCYSQPIKENEHPFSWKSDQVILGYVPFQQEIAKSLPSQPAVDVTGSVSIVYDGCIYNSSCLKTDLSKCGTVIKTGEDPELILYLYRESGMECLKRIQGDFAFALWDGNLRKLILARDRFGIKPLFYYQSERGRFLFSSEIDAILRSNLTDKELDLASLYHYFFLTFCPQPSTIIKKVKSVPPATYVEYDVERDTITTIPYWDIPCTDNKTLLQEEEILEECGRLLTESVRLRSPVNRKVGISLSSGMDSCTIAGFLDKFEPQMNTFTFGFGEKHGHLNEFSLSRLVAEKIGANHQEIRITGKDLLNALPSLARCLDTPTAGAILPYFFLMKAQEFGIQVAFRGDGGNSAFQYLFDEKMPALDKGLSFLRMLPNRMQTSLYNVFDGIFSLAAKRSRGSSTKLQGLFGLLSRYFSLMAGTVNFASMYSERERGGFFKLTDWMNNKEFRGTRDIVLSYFNTNVRDLHERYNYGDFKVYLDQGLTHLGSLSRSLSIDLRLPYFDHVLIEFIQRTVPSSLRQKNGIDKYILKKIAEPVLPPEIINKNSRGFYMPFKEWLMTDLRPVVDDVFSRSTVDSRGIFNYKKVRTIYDRFYSREDSDISWRKIWAFVILEYWFREHIDEKNN